MRIHIESVTDSMVNASYKELEARMKRVEDLERVHAEMTLQKELQVLIKSLTDIIDSIPSQNGTCLPNFIDIAVYYNKYFLHSTILVTLTFLRKFNVSFDHL